MNLATTRAGTRQGSRSEHSFFLVFALATTATAFFGFAFTYFTPMFSGSYPDLSPFVHVHGWSFFAWYLLFPIQALLVTVRQTSLHMLLGRLSLGLVIVMVVTGIFVLAVRMDDALAGGGDQFMAFLRLVGSLIFSNVLLFAVFYGLGIRMALRGRFDAHKRLMVLASSAGLGAALFRISGVFFGAAEWANTAWVLATNAFMVAAMVYDRAAFGRVHPVYWKGLLAALIVEAALWPFPGNPIVPAVNLSLAALGSVVRVIY